MEWSFSSVWKLLKYIRKLKSVKIVFIYQARKRYKNIVKVERTY
jgi:hypothetical protein